MPRLKQSLECLLLLSLSLLVGLLGFGVYHVTQAICALPAGILAEVQNIHSDLDQQLAGTRLEVLGLVDRQATAVQKNALQTIAQEGDKLDTRLDTALALLDKRSGDALIRVDTALGSVQSLEKDARPVLVNAAALTRDAQDSLDDVYWDFKASVESGTVALHSAAVASEEIAKAAPQLAKSTENIEKNVDGITADVHTATTDFVKPKSKWDRFKGWLIVVARVGAAFI